MFTKGFSDKSVGIGSNHWRCSIKKALLKNTAIFTGKQSFSNQVVVLNLATLLKETPTQVFSFEYCKIFKSILFIGYFR